MLGPLLFCIYTRDAPQCFQHALNQLYADDITLYIRHKSIQIITTQLSADLAALDRYLDQKGLVLNPSKTQFVLLRRPGTELPPGTAVNCRGTSIVPSAYARYLGILVDEHLSFSTQVDAVCANVNRKVGAFVHAKQNISIFGKRLFYLSIIQSTFEFGSTAYIHCLSHALYDKLLTRRCAVLRKVDV